MTSLHARRLKEAAPATAASESAGAGVIVHSVLLPSAPLMRSHTSSTLQASRWTRGSVGSGHVQLDHAPCWVSLVLFSQQDPSLHSAQRWPGARLQESIPLTLQTAQNC